jgi:hypothetical protein
MAKKVDGYLPEVGAIVGVADVRQRREMNGDELRENM